MYPCRVMSRRALRSDGAFPTITRRWITLLRQNVTSNCHHVVVNYQGSTTGPPIDNFHHRGANHCETCPPTPVGFNPDIFIIKGWFVRYL